MRHEMQDESNDNDRLSALFEDELDLSTINIESELQCYYEGEGEAETGRDELDFIECDDTNCKFKCKHEITFILFSLEESTSDSIKIHTANTNIELEDDCGECDEILSILNKDKIQLTKSTHLVSFRKETTPFALTPQLENKQSVVIHKPVPKRKNVPK